MCPVHHLLFSQAKPGALELTQNQEDKRVGKSWGEYEKGGTVESVQRQKDKQVPELGLPEIKPEQGHNSAEHQRGWCSLLGDKVGGVEGFYGQPFIDSPRCVGYSSFRLSCRNMSNLSVYSRSIKLLSHAVV